jgi:long-chain acyl-CoA synthetase
MEKLKREKESVLNFLKGACEKYPNRVALNYLGKTYTYFKLNELIDRFATALDAQGVKKGDRIIIYLPNTPQFLIALYAIMKIGGVSVPISPIYTPQEIGYIARDSGVETVICQDVNFGYVKEILPQSPVKRIIYTNLVDMLPWWKKIVGIGFNRVPRGKTEKGEGISSFLDLLKYPPKPTELEIDNRKDLCWILYTGGTMGLPKGVPIPPAYMYYGSLDFMEIARGTFIEKGGSQIILVLPLFHALSQFIFNGFVLALGNTAILMPQADVDAILEVIQRNKVELFAGVPTLYRMILENDRIDQYDLSSLRYCWGFSSFRNIQWVAKQIQDTFVSDIRID